MGRSEVIQGWVWNKHAKTGVYIYLYDSPVTFLLPIHFSGSHCSQIGRSPTFTKSTDIKILVLADPAMRNYALTVCSKAVQCHLVTQWIWPGACLPHPKMPSCSTPHHLGSHLILFSCSFVRLTTVQILSLSGPLHRESK